MGRELREVFAPEPYLAITWQVNNFCNFSCSYCNPGNWAGDNPNNGNLDLYIAHLDEICKRYKKAGYKNFNSFSLAVSLLHGVTLFLFANGFMRTCLMLL